MFVTFIIIPFYQIMEILQYSHPYRDTRAYILDHCIREFSSWNMLSIILDSLRSTHLPNFWVYSSPWIPQFQHLIGNINPIRYLKVDKYIPISVLLSTLSKDLPLKCPNYRTPAEKIEQSYFKPWNLVIPIIEATASSWGPLPCAIKMSFMR